MKADPMVTDTAARKAPPPEPEHLPCPRCDSTNTKFCYYNNYNFSQPRHFCKSCRRYWTHGGTLRDIPIGGGSRKNAKRSRTASIGATSVFSSSHHHHDFRNFPAGASQLLVPFAADHGQFVSDAKMCGSFTSLLNTQATGLWALGGFGIGPGLDDVGFGLGKTVWPFPGALEGGPSNGSIMPAHTWHHVENAAAAGGGGESGGDSFAFPDLAISTPGGGSFMK